MGVSLTNFVKKKIAHCQGVQLESRRVKSRNSKQGRLRREIDELREVLLPTQRKKKNDFSRRIWKFRVIGGKSPVTDDLIFETVHVLRLFFQTIFVEGVKSGISDFAWEKMQKISINFWAKITKFGIRISKTCFLWGKSWTVKNWLLNFNNFIENWLGKMFYFCKLRGCIG